MQIFGIRGMRTMTFSDSEENKNKNKSNNFYFLNFSSNNEDTNLAFLIMYDSITKSYFLEKQNDKLIIYEKISDSKTNLEIDRSYKFLIGGVNFNVNIKENSLTVETINNNEFSEKFLFSNEDCPITLGRSILCNVKLQSKKASKVHCILGYDESQSRFYIQDGDNHKASTNGTWMEIENRILIKDNKCFKMNDYSFKCELVGDL